MALEDEELPTIDEELFRVCVVIVLPTVDEFELVIDDEF